MPVLSQRKLAHGERRERALAKCQHLLDKGMISTAESFIDQGAAESSMSGKRYQVWCGTDAGSATSVAWFKAELARYRRAAK